MILKKIWGAAAPPPAPSFLYEDEVPKLNQSPMHRNCSETHAHYLVKIYKGLSAATFSKYYYFGNSTNPFSVPAIYFGTPTQVYTWENCGDGIRIDRDTDRAITIISKVKTKSTFASPVTTHLRPAILFAFFVKLKTNLLLRGIHLPLNTSVKNHYQLSTKLFPRLKTSVSTLKMID